MDHALDIRGECTAEQMGLRLLEAFGARTRRERRRFLERHGDCAVEIEASDGRRACKPLSFFFSTVPGGPAPWGRRTVGLTLVLGGLFGPGHSLLHRIEAVPAFSRAELGRQQVQAIAFEGVVQPSALVTLASTSSGVVKRTFVRVGDPVQAGQEVLLLDDAEKEDALAAAVAEQQRASLRVSQLRARLAAATGRVALVQRRTEDIPSRQWRDSPERAQAAYELAATQCKRQETLYRDGIISRQELEVAQAALKMAQDDLENARRLSSSAAELEAAQQQQERLQVQVAEMEAREQLQRAELNLKAARSRVEGLHVRSSTAGVVVDVPAQVGDRVYAGTALVHVADLHRMRVHVPVAASMVSMLRRGQRAVVTVPDDPTRRVDGAIAAIGPVPTPNMTYTVEVEFENTGGAMLAGQPAEVRFLP